MNLNIASNQQLSAGRTAFCGIQKSHACKHVTVVRATTDTATELSGKERPAWSGDQVLSKLVNALISSPLYNLMKPMAKNTIKNSAIKRNVDWEGHVAALKSNPKVQQLKEQIENKNVTYPSYYLMPFHAYDEGNLNWLAAYEVEPATYAMAIRTFKTELELSPEQLFDKLKRPVTDKLKAYVKEHNLPQTSNIIDIGCSTGMSARWLGQEYPEAQVTGLDLSPHFLAVAEWQEREEEAKGLQRQRIKYIHRQAEDTGLEGGSYDMVSCQFVLHECPQDASLEFITESRRLLKPGGIAVFTDNNPRSKTIQNLPPFLFTLMKSTEPWSDDYYTFDLEGAMRENGFREVISVDTDHRHRAVIGIAA